MTTLQVGGATTNDTGSTEHNCELDSHADTCVIGHNAFVLNKHPRFVSIVGYDATAGASPKLNAIDVALAYNSPTDGTTHILRINQAVLVPTMHHNLLCPMQMRLNDVEVHDLPRVMSRTITEKSHSIIVSDTEHSVKLLISLTLDGVTSCFTTRTPTPQELWECTHYDLTYSSPEYHPHELDLASREERLLMSHKHSS